MSVWLEQHVVEVLIAILLAVIAFSMRRFIATQDAHGERIKALETDRVTRDDFDELRHSLTATAAQNHELVTARLDRILEHMAGLK